MDVRLETQLPGRVQWQPPARREEYSNSELDRAEQDIEPKQETKAQAAPPPQLMTREELQQFLLMLGSSRGSEEMLAAMLHDAKRMQNALLSGRS
jgi:hypothetical protein